MPKQINIKALLFTFSFLLSSCTTVYKINRGGKARVSLKDRIEIFDRDKEWSNSKDLKIYWTKESIPYIKAETDEDLFYGSGLVQAHLRGTQLEMFRFLSRGRFSEAVGESALPMDIFLRTINIGKASDQIISNWSSDTKLYAKAFIRGINDYNKNLDRLPLDIKLMGIKKIEPWTIKDLVYVHRLMGLDINWQVWSEFMKVYREKNYQDFNFFWKTWVEKFFNSSMIPKKLSLDSLGLINGITEAGSNAFVVDGKKSYSGKPIVAGDPHLGINLPSYWLFMGLESPSFKIFGINIPSFPTPVMGRTPNIAWTGTNMWGVSSFLYKLEDKDLENSTTRTEVFKSRFTSSKKEVIVTDTEYGPLVSNTKFLKSKMPLALKWAGHRPSIELEALLQAAQAKDVFEFKRALKQFSVVAINYVVADKKGNISKVHAAHLPVLKNHKKSFVQEPSNTIIEYQDVMKLPEMLNPKTGYVVSANEFNDAAKYSLCWFCSTPDRANRISKLLEDDVIDIDDVKKIQIDIYSEEAKELTKFLMYEWKRFNFLESKNYKILQEWDFRYSIEDKAPYLYEELISRFSKNIYKILGLKASDTDPLSENLVWKRAIVQNYKKMTEVQKRSVFKKTFKSFNRLKAKKWGHVHKIKVAHPLADIPLIGRSYNYYEAGYPGTSNTVFKAAHGYKGDYNVTFGANLRVIFDMSDEDENYAVLLGGQDGYLGSKSFSDQIPKWIKNEYYKIPFTQEAIKKESVFENTLKAN